MQAGTHAASHACSHACRRACRRACSTSPTHLHELRLAGLRPHGFQQLLHPLLALPELRAAGVGLPARFGGGGAQGIRVAVGCSTGVEGAAAALGNGSSCCALLCTWTMQGGQQAQADSHSAHFSNSASAASVVCAASAASQVCPGLLASALLSFTDADDGAAVQIRTSSTADRRQKLAGMLGMAGDRRRWGGLE